MVRRDEEGGMRGEGDEGREEEGMREGKWG